MSENTHLPQEPWLAAQMLEANPSAIILVDAVLPDMPIIYVNAAFERFTGYTRSEVMGRNCRFLQGADRDQPQIAVIRRAIREQTAATVTMRNYRKDGSLFYNELRISPLRDQAGNVTHFVGIQNDVTERIETETALQEFGLRYQSLFSGSFNAVFLHDLEGNFIDANDSALELLGFSRQEIMQLSFASVLEPEEQERALETLQSIMATGSQRTPTVFRVKTRDGGSLYLETISSVVYRQGEPWALQGIARDITEQRRMEIALRESETRLRAMIEASPDLIFRVHRDGTHLDYHAPSEDLLAVSPSEFLGKKITDVLDPEMSATLMKLYQEVLSTQKMVIYEYELAVQSGVRQFEARIVPSGADETVTYVRDVTAVRQAEKQEIALRLEQERTRLLTEFIKNASHEFLTPLAIINSSADLIARAEGDAEFRRSKVEQITLQVSQITKLVEMLLMMVTLESGQADAERVNLSDMFEAVRYSVTQRSSLHGRLSLAIAPDLPEISGSHKLLTMAMSHLIENAERYSDPDSEIQIRVYPSDGQVAIEVEDHGIGISEGALPHIFETFWRQDEAHSTAGFGLGLSIVRKVIELHGGRIEVESELGKGSLFRVFLPDALAR